MSGSSGGSGGRGVITVKTWRRGACRRLKSRRPCVSKRGFAVTICGMYTCYSEDMSKKCQVCAC